MSTALADIINKNALNLKPDLKKQVAKLNQKIINTNYYQGKKKLAKMGELANDELNLFLLDCALEYDKAYGEFLLTEHHDVTTLRGIWSAMSFSRDERILAYFKQQLDRSLANKGFVHRYLFEIFRLHDAGHELLPALYEYYDELRKNLKIYRLLEQIGVAPSDPYDFHIGFTLVNFDTYFSDTGLSGDELARKFRLDINLHAPFIYDKTFEISISNSDVPRVRVDFNDGGVSFCQKADESAFGAADILNLKPFLQNLQSYFGVKFSPDSVQNGDMSYLGVTKGLNRAKITAWFKQILQS